ncbi:MAG: SUMF1/EgtB/PvdO family nonheme iron enzyme [Gallionella sp.]|nr:SUMF1/EgtB/PvdO family nonheme iron enzyme [Gallionella sp.]
MLQNLVLIQKFDDAIASDFFISPFPVSINEFREMLGLVSTGSDGDGTAQKATWSEAIHYCNWLSLKHHLPVAYSEETGRLLDESGNPAPDIFAVVGFRLPTMIEWEYAAKGWVKNKVGDYDAIQRKNFRVPFLDYPTTADDIEFFQHGFSNFEKMPLNTIGLYGLLGNAREWYSDMEEREGIQHKLCYWEEYVVNYDNAFSHQVRGRIVQKTDVYVFRVVLKGHATVAEC